MKNKRYKYILKAHRSSRFPHLLSEELSDMMLTFEFIDQMALNALKGKGFSKPAEPLLIKAEKDRISALISNPNIEQKKRDELMLYYRLTILVIDILDKVAENHDSIYEKWATIN